MSSLIPTEPIEVRRLLIDYLPRVAGYVRPYWRLAIVSASILLFHVFLGLLGPWPLKLIIDNVLGGQPLPSILRGPLGAFRHNQGMLLTVLVVLGLFVTVFENWLNVLHNYVDTRLKQGMVLDLRSDLFRHAHRLSLSFHNRHRTGQVIYAVNGQADAAVGLAMSVPALAQSILTLAGILWITFQIDRELALVSLLVVPILHYAVGYYNSRMQGRLTEVRQIESDSMAIIHEAINMLRVIVAFGREPHEYQRFRAQAERANRARLQLTIRQTLFSLWVNLTTASGTALVLGLGASHVLSHQLTVGQLLVVMSYVSSVYGPLESITYTIGGLQGTLTSLRIAFGLLDTEPEIKDAPGARAVGRAQGTVTFDHVSFSYNGRVNTLIDLSFVAPAGKVVAIVGPTGAGKTTLASLLMRFYDPVGGRILLDGTDLRQITLASLRSQLSVVLQEPLLFAGSIAENIRYGRLDATQAEIEAAATSANAHHFIMALPEQYETPVGERGAQLSGGERQRIAVARAFIKDAPILILDEPTSSIDSRTEGVILDALDRLMVGRTTFMIAHRLSTVRHADQILVMDHGRLVEAGRHEELLNRDGLYRQLHDMQHGARSTRPALPDEMYPSSDSLPAAVMPTEELAPL